MARSIATIYDSIVEEKETFASLSGLSVTPDSSQLMLTQLSTTSKVGIWRLFSHVAAVLTNTIENLMDIFKVEVQTIATNAIPCTIRWYSTMSKQWQNGFQLSWDGEKWGYDDSTSVSAQTAQIITQCNASESGAELYVKVAQGELGSLTTLTSDQEDSFKEYIQRRKLAGTIVNIRNATAQVLNYNYTINYDPLILNSSGELITDTSISPAELAADNFIQGLAFDSIFNVMEFTSAIEGAVGVTNAICTACDVENPVVDILTETGQQYNPFAGYFSTGTGTTFTYSI